MGLIDTIRDGARRFLGIDDYQERPRIDAIEHNRKYTRGEQKKMLKVKGYDDNVTVNVSGIIVDRWVSWLFGHGVYFDLPGEDESKEQEYIDTCWELNRKEILLHRIAMNGGVSGNAYVKIIPNGLGDLPRLVAVDPTFIKMDTDPDDIDKVIRYTISYGDSDDKYRKTEVSQLEGNTWTVRVYTKQRGQQEAVEEKEWGYDFAPIVHCQNLPCSTSCYGYPDIDKNTRAMQDNVNFIASNINKIIRLHGHPQTWGNNVSNLRTIEWGPDKIIDAGPDGQVHNLEMQNDLTSSINFLQWYIKQLYATTRTVDLDSLADKLGALTNFGLHVLFQDTLTKLATKRALYGEMLTEINRRLLVIGGFANTDPGKIEWNDVIPENKMDTVTYLQALKNLGIISNETIAMKAGLDYAVEQEKIANDKASESNIGAALLSAFNRNQDNTL